MGKPLVGNYNKGLPCSYYPLPVVVLAWILSGHLAEHSSWQWQPWRASKSFDASRLFRWLALMRR